MYVLRLGSVTPDDKVKQVKKFRAATKHGLRESKRIMDAVDLYGECKLSRSFINPLDAEELRKEGFHVFDLLPDNLFTIE